MAHEAFAGVVAGPRWTALAAEGAHVQRPLWASTGVKDPAYKDTRYVVDLVTQDVVNTMPEATLDAVRDHGETTGDTIVPEYAAAHAALAALTAAGVDLDDVVKVLEDEGVEKFVVAWEQLLDALRSALDAARAAAGR